MNNSPSDSSSIFRIGVPLSIALLTFFVFPLLSDMYAVQLRELSAMLTAVFLRMGTLSITRSGTILALPGMTFDIIPACSGSNMLRALIFVGIIWSGIHPKLTPVRKLLATLLAVVVATLANSIRLSVLLWSSYLRGEVIAEGPLHSLIGLVAFAAALPGFFAVTELLVRRAKETGYPAAPASNLLAFTMVLMFLAYLPILSACAIAWKGTVYNINDQFGFIFFLIGTVAWSLVWRRTPADHRSMMPAALLFLGAALLAVLSQVLGSNYYVLGITMMISMFAVGLGYRGIRFALRCLLFQFIIFLSFPKVGETINGLLGTSGLAPILIGKTILTTSALIAFRALYKSMERPLVSHRQPTPWAALITVAAAITLVGQLYLARSNDTQDAHSYYLPYLLGQNAEWEGFDIADSESVIFYERGNVINRQYVHGNQQAGVMIVPSDGNRKTIHTPEYCQTGLGWEVLETETIQFENRYGNPATAKKLLLRSKVSDAKRTFIYWFGDDVGTTLANYPTFIVVDTLRKFRGEKTNWILYVVWSDSGESAALELIEQLPHIQVTNQINGDPHE